MNVHLAEKRVKESLAGIYDEGEAAIIAAMLIEDLTGLSRTERLLNNDPVLADAQLIRMEDAISRLKTYEPIQYILNKSWFYGMELFVDRHVLIPRPETEELVEWVIRDVKASGMNVFDKKPNDADMTKSLKLLDVGTGSGCIALAMKKMMPRAEVWGCDISETALNIARRNGSELDIRVDFQSINFLERGEQKHLPTVDIVISNPPYVPLSDKESMLPNVVEHEPHTALFVENEDPLIFYKALAEFGRHRLYPGGSIYMEIHENLGSGVVELFDKGGYETELRSDMQGKSRMVKAKKSL
jgi:release factor glutamine methyltransferase